MANTNNDWKLKWRAQLAELGWQPNGSCPTCGGTKYYFKRGNEIMNVWPGRDFYEFHEGGIRKTGKLSNLGDIINAANAQQN